jgi:hypothetical protein
MDSTDVQYLTGHELISYDSEGPLASFYLRQMFEESVAISDARDIKDTGPRFNPISYERIVYRVPDVNPDLMPFDRLEETNHFGEETAEIVWNGESFPVPNYSKNIVMKEPKIGETAEAKVVLCEV